MGVIAVISVDFILASDDWHGPAELVDELLLAVAEHRCADVVGKRIASVNVDHGFVSLGCRCQGSRRTRRGASSILWNFAVRSAASRAGKDCLVPFRFLLWPCLLQ